MRYQTTPSLVQIMAWCLFLGSSHYLNQCWHVVNWTLENKFLWNLNPNSNIFIQENVFENVVINMVNILSWPQCVKSWTYSSVAQTFWICFVKNFKTIGQFKWMLWRSRISWYEIKISEVLPNRLKFFTFITFPPYILHYHCLDLCISIYTHLTL